MPIRKRTGDVMLRKREKFGRKVAEVGCVVTNGGFETGDFTEWEPHYDCQVLQNGAAEGQYYCRVSYDGPEPAYVYKTVYCVPAGWTLHIQYRLVSSFSYDHVRLYTPGPYYGAITLYPNVNWTAAQKTIGSDATGGYLHITIHMSHFHSPGNYLDIDDVYMTQ